MKGDGDSSRDMKRERKEYCLVLYIFMHMALGPEARQHTKKIKKQFRGLRTLTEKGHVFLA